ncbi:MAG: dipeptide epimerase [Saprospiraceae bacterium]|nr:dipeptide epimerase [Saprospiraceae bacterium]
MKITAVKVWRENLELTRPYTIAYRTIDKVENIFVSIEGVEGIRGIGAASPAVYVTGEVFEESLQLLQTELSGCCEGQDIRHLSAILRTVQAKLAGHPAALAAADIALHDLFTQYLKVPLVKYLGQCHKGLATSVTIGIMSVEETLEAAKEWLDQGFKILKVKTGNDVERDIEVVRKLREQFGPDFGIRVDANQGYDLADLAHFLDGVSTLNLEFVEQPLPRGKFPELQTAEENIRQQCAADEDLHDPKDAIPLLSSPIPYGIFNIKLMKCGGIQPALSIADMAHHSGRHLMWGCNDESIVSITAALHAALACPATRYIDLDGSLDLARDVVAEGFLLKEGIMYPNDKPGLGVVQL